MPLEGGETVSNSALLGKAMQMLELLRLIGVEAWIVDADRTVLGVAEADDLADPTRPFRLQQGRLECATAGIESRFGRTFKYVLQAAAGWRTIVALNHLYFATLVRHAIDDCAVVVIFLASRSLNDRICPSCLVRLFDLTAREAEVAAMLGNGLRLSAIAQNLKMSLGTVRTHVRHIYQKADVQSQGQLAAMIAACAFGRCPPDAPSCCAAAPRRD